jgi:hypothetical protein
VLCIVKEVKTGMPLNGLAIEIIETKEARTRAPAPPNPNVNGRLIAK